MTATYTSDTTHRRSHSPSTAGCSTSQRSPPRWPTSAARASRSNRANWARSSPQAGSAARTVGSITTASAGRACRESCAGGDPGARTPRSHPVRQVRDRPASTRCRMPADGRSRRGASVVASGGSSLTTPDSSGCVDPRRVVGHSDRFEALAKLADALIDSEFAEEACQHDFPLDTADGCGHLIQQRGHEQFRN